MISAGNNAGGVCGTNDGTIEKSYNTAMVSAVSNAGGVCGANGTGKITGCFSIGTVSEAALHGGVCGTNSGTVTNCFYLAGSAAGGIDGGDVQNAATVLTLAQITGTEALSNMPGFLPDDWNTKLNQNLGNIAKEDGIFASENCFVPQLKVFGDTNFIGGVKAVKVLDAETGDDQKLYYLIHTAADLKTFRDTANVMGRYCSLNAKLTADICLNPGIDFSVNADGTPKNDLSAAESWMPIAYYSFEGKYDDIYYTGTFDGQGHTISGLYYDNPDQSYCGLFGQLETDAVIKNLGITNSFICGDGTVGAICGFAYEATIENCYSTATVTGQDYDIGGILGSAYFITIENCYYAGTISGGNSTGGICGSVYFGQINNCYNTGKVSVSQEVAGGICGGSSSCTIRSCYNTGKVVGEDLVGSICGYNGGTIEGCYYLSGSASDINGVIQNGIGTYNQGEAAEDTEGSTTALTMEQMTAPDALKTMSFDTAIWKMDANVPGEKYTLPSLKNTKGDPFLSGINPTYIVVIPATVDIGGTAEVTASDVSLNYDQELRVSVNSDFVLKETPLPGFSQKDSVPFTMNINNHPVSNGDVILRVPYGTQTASVEFGFDLSSESKFRYSGAYSGIVTFIVSTPGPAN